jgi:hypothetical protein
VLANDPQWVGFTDRPDGAVYIRLARCGHLRHDRSAQGDCRIFRLAPKRLLAQNSIRGRSDLSRRTTGAPHDWYVRRARLAFRARAEGG